MGSDKVDIIGSAVSFSSAMPTAGACGLRQTEFID